MNPNSRIFRSLGGPGLHLVFFGLALALPTFYVFLKPDVWVAKVYADDRWQLSFLLISQLYDDSPSNMTSPGMPAGVVDFRNRYSGRYFTNVLCSLHETHGELPIEHPRKRRLQWYLRRDLRTLNLAGIYWEVDTPAQGSFFVARFDHLGIPKLFASRIPYGTELPSQSRPHFGNFYGVASFSTTEELRNGLIDPGRTADN